MGYGNIKMVYDFSSISTGDHLRRKAEVVPEGEAKGGGGFYHHVIVAEVLRPEEKILVIHNVPDGGVQRDIEEFEPGLYEKVLHTVSRSVQDILKKAMDKIGFKYDLLDYNCEHFVNDCIEGKKFCEQISDILYAVGKGFQAFMFAGGLKLQSSKSKKKMKIKK